MASVIYPPTIVASPNTPANEWAQETTTEVNSVGDQHTKVEELGAVSNHHEFPHETSGIPGGYPGIIGDYDAERLKENTKEALAIASEAAQELYQKAEHTAKEYAPVAQQAVNETSQTIYKTAQNAARQYLPESIVGKLEQVGVLGSNPISNGYVEDDTDDKRPLPYTTMPTDEVGPFHPTHAGIGTLPGLPNEEGVAKLPDERIEELREELPTREIERGPTHGGVGSLPGTKSETSVAKLPEERSQSEGQAASLPLNSNADPVNQLRDELPSREVDTGPTHGGVGTLPGSRSESGVAKLPEERNAEAKGSESSGYREGYAVISGRAARHPVEKQTQKILPLTEEFLGSGQPTVLLNTQNHIPIDDNNINDITGQKTRGTGAGLHSVEPVVPRTVVVEGGKNAEQTTADTHDKISMTTKLKANVKIFGGKITRDKDLVEEGKSLKNGN